MNLTKLLCLKDSPEIIPKTINSVQILTSEYNIIMIDQNLVVIVDFLWPDRVLEFRMSLKHPMQLYLIYPIQAVRDWLNPNLYSAPFQEIL